MEAFRKLLETLAPILTEDGALSLSIFHWAIVCPRMYFKCARAFSATIAENLVRPPAFEITATPNAHTSHMWKFQCAIHPATASPSWRTHIPIRMIIERNDHNRFRNQA